MSDETTTNAKRILSVDALHTRPLYLSFSLSVCFAYQLSLVSSPVFESFTIENVRAFV